MFRPAVRRAIPVSRTPIKLLRNYLATAVPGNSSVTSPSISEPENNSLANEEATKPGALRPHLDVKVRVDHGLFSFFRKVEDENSVQGYKYLTIEESHSGIHDSSK